MELHKKNETGEQSSDDRNQNIAPTAGTDNRNPDQGNNTAPNRNGEENDERENRKADGDEKVTMKP